MNILTLSDLHLELRQHQRAEFFKKIQAKADVLVLAGDICYGWQIPNILGKFCQMYEHVIYVHGNHEFYTAERATVLDFTAQAVSENKNLSWLDCNSVEINGVWFHGTPLWFKEAPKAPKQWMNDFRMIFDFESWVYSENKRAVDYLTDHVGNGDVVVTHYLPSPKSCHPKYAEWKALDPFFLCDVEGLILAKEPAIWIHGHTHSSFDYPIGKTRVVANPHGYGRENVEEFKWDKVIELANPSTPPG